MFDSSTQSFLVSQIAFVLLLLLSVGATTARAQVSISGTVEDAESSDPLPAAGIRIDGIG